MCVGGGHWVKRGVFEPSFRTTRLTGLTEALLTHVAVYPRWRDRSRRDQCPGATYSSMVTAGDLLVQDGRRVPDLSVFIDQAAKPSRYVQT